jgi:hypothetical protein
VVAGHGAHCASCGFSRVSCGFVGVSDGWRDLMDNFRMDWEFGSATNGNIAVMGELDLDGVGKDGAYRVHARLRHRRRPPHGRAKDHGLAGHAV